ncbi:hypothetical protein SpCBS45565_g01350 [Spizellomyces sp. 'palustris']|nr:hypothetical protein SpCBS45565_g01350 [Spizellomyces sp. 'palustris']
MPYRRVFIGKLPNDVTQREVEKLVTEFGRVTEYRILSGYAFVEFENEQDARDCVKVLDGEKFHHARLIVEPAHTQADRRRRDQYVPTTTRRGGRSSHRIIVQNLPNRTSWQDGCVVWRLYMGMTQLWAEPRMSDVVVPWECRLLIYLGDLHHTWQNGIFVFGFHLWGLPRAAVCLLSQEFLSYLALETGTASLDLKDLMRKAGEVIYTDVSREGEGIVEFSNLSDMEEAMRMFQDYDYEGQTLSVKEERSGSPQRRSDRSSRRRSVSPRRRSPSPRRRSRSPRR